MEIIGRAQWGARYPAGFGPAPLPARELWLHHTAMATPPADQDVDQDVGDVRQIERIGQQRFGGGISYTFVVCPSGRVFEGTGVDRQGAHTKGRNSISRAIVLHGNYDVAPPTSAMLAAVADLVAQGAASHWWPAQLTGGHRDAPGASTACPGRYAYAQIATINAAARGAAREEPDVELSDKVHDYYAPGRPDLTVADALAWAAAHSGQAVDLARQALDTAAAARQDIAALRQQVATMGGGSGIDPQLVADAVAQVLARKLASG
jgi:hypothetical protein